MQYDVFISYRRVGGKEYARLLKPELEKRGFEVFLDFDELSDGVFDQRIKDAISASPVFLLILSRGALDRCVNEGDWVREEILHANRCHCHIIPVEFDKSFREMPAATPADISAIVGAHTWAQIDTETLLQESVDKMVQRRIRPYIHHEEGQDSSASRPAQGIEVHIDVDADCDLFRFKTFVSHLKAGEDNVVHLNPGKYKFVFVSTQEPEVRESMVYALTSDIACDFIEVELKEKVEEVIARHKEEEKRKSEEEAKNKAEEEARRKAEEERQRAENAELRPIRKGRKYGFADESGKVVIPCQWECAFPFSEGLARVLDANGKWGFIDKTGKVVIPCRWKVALRFTEGLALMLDANEKWGYIDKTGKLFKEGW